MNGCRNRRYARVIALGEKFQPNTCVIEKAVWQDEKDFTLDVPVNLKTDRLYGKGKKSDVPDENLFASTIRFQAKLWFPMQSLGMAPRNRFFVNENGIKANKENYCKH